MLGWSYSSWSSLPKSPHTPPVYANYVCLQRLKVFICINYHYVFFHCRTGHPNLLCKLYNCVLKTTLPGLVCQHMKYIVVTPLLACGTCSEVVPKILPHAVPKLHTLLVWLHWKSSTVLIPQFCDTWQGSSLRKIPTKCYRPLHSTIDDLYHTYIVHCTLHHCEQGNLPISQHLIRKCCTSYVGMPAQTTVFY